MSQSFQQGIYGYGNVFNRSTMMHQDQQQNMAQHRPPPIVLDGIDTGESAVYDQSGGITMLSDMFNFPPGAAPPADMLENHITDQNYRSQRPPATTSEWYGNTNRLGIVGGLGGETKQHHSNINADSMQLFLMNPSQRRSPSPASSTPTSATPLHLLLPNPSTASPSLQGYHSEAASFGSNQIPQTQFTWISDSGGGDAVEGQGRGRTQGLSLSLSSLQHLEAVKAEEMRMGDGSNMVYYNQQGPSSSSSYHIKNLANQYQQLQGMGQNQNTNNQIHVGYSSSSFGVINLLRNSKYAKAAQELLEEFCSVGRGHMKNTMRFGRNNKNPNNTNQSGGESSSLSKEPPPLSSAEKLEYQRKKATLLSMLDEVDRRYNHYCEQMQMVVNSFDSVMGYGAATPYTVLAQKAMSRHFRCLKDAIVAQLKIIRELVGEKDGAGSSGITKGETPRLKLLDQSLRQQRAFQQMGIMDQEAWRPQRGLPERSVTILRAWLFEHFLHPYPSDADKHLLARQTGLSRNQVSNWFINARVRLWKPMVEEMYQQESKEGDDPEEEEDDTAGGERNNNSDNAQPPTPSSATTPTTGGGSSSSRRSEKDAMDKDPSLIAINRQCFSENQARYNSDVSPTTTLQQRYNQVGRGGGVGSSSSMDFVGTTTLGAAAAAAADIDSKLVRFGTTTTGDVSLTLGLKHTGKLPENNNQFTLGDFSSC
ncbi:hypothetical protein ACHQM5_016982 [Ranunculus cassubicifolius]